MKNIKKNPRTAGAIAALYQKIQKCYPVAATARWQKDGLWVEGTVGDDCFEGLICYNDEGELIVDYFATWNP